MENINCRIYEKRASQYTKELQHLSSRNLPHGSFAFITKTKSIGLEKCIYCKKIIPEGNSVIALKSLVGHPIEKDTRSTISPQNSAFCASCFGEIAVKLSLEEDVKCPNIIINNDNGVFGATNEQVRDIILESCQDAEYKDYMDEKSRNGNSAGLSENKDKTTLIIEKIRNFLIFSSICIGICLILSALIK